MIIEAEQLFYMIKIVATGLIIGSIAVLFLSLFALYQAYRELYKENKDKLED